MDCGNPGEKDSPEALVAVAERLCARRGQRFTPVRREVFAILAHARSPMTAYQILDRVLTSGRESGPPTVYRALDFLQQQHLVHRVESRNAFLACVNPEAHHDCQLLICTDCGTTAEVQSRTAMARLSAAAKAVGFSVSGAVVELTGLCARCRTALLGFASRRRPDRAG